MRPVLAVVPILHFIVFQVLPLRPPDVLHHGRHIPLAPDASCDDGDRDGRCAWTLILNHSPFRDHAR